MRNLLLPAVLAGILLPIAARAEPQPVSPAVADVCVYGGTAAGVMAAVAAKREGKSVIIVEPARTLGGMVGGGIRVNRDTRHPGDIGGLTRMMMEKDIAIGGGRHENQPQFRKAFDELVAKHGITVLYHHRLGTIAKTGTKIERLLLDYAPVEGGASRHIMAYNFRFVWVPAGQGGRAAEKAAVTALAGGWCKIRYGERMIEFDTVAKGTYALDAALKLTAK